MPVVAVEPAASAGAVGPAGRARTRSRGSAPGFVPAVLNRESLDEVMPVGDEAAIETARLAARREGVLCGISCGAALWAALEVGAPPRVEGPRGSSSILPDSGERYVSTPFFAPAA